MQKLRKSYSKAIYDVQVAGGANHQVKGFVYLNISFDGRDRKLKVYLVPTFRRLLTLGMDFWSAFDVVPAIACEVSFGYDSDPKQHILTPEQQKQLAEAVKEIPSFNEIGLGRTNLLEHDIDVGEAKPVKQRVFPMSPAMLKIMDQEIDEMVKMDIIEKCEGSGWCSNVVMVKKSNGSWRLCLDAREINKPTIKDAYPLTTIDGVYRRIGKIKYVSKLDLKYSFWQVPLSERAKNITAFPVQGRGLYRYKVMPFGLKNASQTLCKLMDMIVPYELQSDIFTYIDDALICSETFEEHCRLIRIFGKRLREANITINVEKSKFCQRETDYLGFVIGEDGLKPNPEKVEAIVNFRRPTTLKELRRFTAMCQWYMRLIPNYAAIAAPLTDMTSPKKFTKDWTPEAISAFEKLKQMLSSEPVLSSPDYSRPFIIQCDASISGVGGALIQKDDSGVERPVAFMSRKLNGAQKNYSITELECLAAVLAIKKFRPYIEGTRFVVVTDHASLKWLMSLRDLSGRLARWSIKLQAYDFEIIHRCGKDNIVADALSRAVESISIEDPNASIDLNSKAFGDPKYLEFVRTVDRSPEKFPDLKVLEDKIYKRVAFRDQLTSSETEFWRLWLPESLRETVMRQLHCPPNSAHPGINKLLEKIRRYYYWPKCLSDVVNFVKSCEICKISKLPNSITRPPMIPRQPALRPWQELHIDYVGPFPRSKSGFTQVLVILDNFSKYVVVRPVRQATARVTIDTLKEYVFNYFGVPQKILSDNGSQFVSNEFKHFLDDLGITHIRTGFYSPQANSAERVNKTIFTAVRMYITDNHKDWDINLGSIACAFRNVVHESTGFSPYYTLFGIHMIHHANEYKILEKLECLSGDTPEIASRIDRLQVIREKVADILRKAQVRHAKAYNLRSREVTFNVGQTVYRRNFCQSDAARGYSAKLAPKLIKCRIKTKCGNSIYEIEDISGKYIGRFHAKDLSS